MIAYHESSPRIACEQIGHKTASMTLGVYTDVGNRQHPANEQLGSRLRGPQAAHSGTNPAEVVAAGEASGATNGADGQYLPDLNV